MNSRSINNIKLVNSTTTRETAGHVNYHLVEYSWWKPPKGGTLHILSEKDTISPSYSEISLQLPYIADRKRSAYQPQNTCCW